MSIDLAVRDLTAGTTGPAVLDRPVPRDATDRADRTDPQTTVIRAATAAPPVGNLDMFTISAQTSTTRPTWAAPAARPTRATTSVVDRWRTRAGERRRASARYAAVAESTAAVRATWSAQVSVPR